MSLGSFLGRVGRYGVRAGTAFASGGASEVYRGVTGHADPVTSRGEAVVTDLSNKVGSLTQGPQDLSTIAETPDEKKRREDREAGTDADLEAARRVRDKLTGAPTPLPREAPQVGAPTPITPVQAGAPSKVTSSLDTTDADQARAAYQAYIDKQRAIAEGTAGPSAAELAMRRGNAEALRAQLSLASGARGYSQGAARRSMDNTAMLQQQNVAQTGELRAQEIAAANERLGTAIATGRAQDITQATAKGQQGLDAARANQAAELQTTLANAGWSNEAIQKMSDQELSTRLANAGYKLTQQQIDDLREKTYRDQGLTAQGQVLTAGQGQVTTANDREAKLAQLRQMQADAHQRGDAATEQMIATLITSYLQYG